jgi:glutathione S-transferase
MITLHTFGPYFGLPDASPFVMKGEMLMKLSGLPYETNTRGFGKAPKGKLPYIRDGEIVVADSTLIRMYLEKKYSIDFDRTLSTRDRGIAWSAEKMLEDHLYWVLIYWRWVKDANFEKGPKAFFKRAPALIRPLVMTMVRRKVRSNLHAHGLGRHSEEETTAMATRSIDALSQTLGDSQYFMGSAPCGADATVFSFVAGVLCPLFDSPVRDKMASTPNLVAYCDRMMKEFYPAFARQ